MKMNYFSYFTKSNCTFFYENHNLLSTVPL